MANWDASIVFCSDFVIRSAIVICHCECKPYPMTTDTALICPRCELPLKEVRTSGSVFWACDNCGGRAATIELLRNRFTPESINPLWLHAMGGEGRSGVLCPSCRHPDDRRRLVRPGRNQRRRLPALPLRVVRHA